MGDNITGLNFPLVSVGIPTYNNPENLERVLDCITGQTYRNLEIIVSDNCSPDTLVGDIAWERWIKDSRIKYYRQQTNIGADKNFCFVRDISKGKYFMWAQDDDWWSPAYIENLVKELEANPGIPLAASPSQYVSRTGEQSPVHQLNNLSAFNAVGNGDLGLACMGLWRRSDVKKFEIQFPPDLVLGVDHVQAAQVILACGKIAIVKSELYKKGYTPGKFQDCFKYQPWYAFTSWLFMMKVLSRSEHIPAQKKLLLPFIAGTNFFRACAITAVQFIVSMPDNRLKKIVQSRFFGAN